MSNTLAIFSYLSYILALEPSQLMTRKSQWIRKDVCASSTRPSGWQALLIRQQDLHIQKGGDALTLNQ